MNDILVVDDKPENISLLLNMFGDKGYQVRPAISGEIALKAIEEEIPDLILLDIMMPGLDGYEVSRILKSQEKTKNVPIIFISARGRVEDRVKGFEAGGVDYISKPFHCEGVLARVETQLSLRRMQAQLMLEIQGRKLAQESLLKAYSRLEDLVKERTAELARKSESLEERNIALNVLLERRDEEKREYEENMLKNLEKLIFPYLKKLRDISGDGKQRTLLEIIQNNLEEITSSFTFNKNDLFSKLTPTQVQIANFIKQGLSTKEISSLLNLSPHTISCHRQEIRKRLSLTNNGTNLQVLLASSQGSLMPVRPPKS